MTSTIDTVRQLLPELAPAEKAQVLQWVANSLFNTFPRIHRQPGVQGATLVLSAHEFRCGV